MVNIKTRKKEHIDICASTDVESSDKFTGFSEFSFYPKSLPDINTEDIDLSATFLNTSFGMPVLIPGMVGGTSEGHEINLRLAQIAQEFNIPMGVGSQRISLENDETAKYFKLKDRFPNIFLISNVGISVLKENDYVSKCKRAVDMIEADALSIHVNVMQELVQKEGLRDFSGIFPKIKTVASELNVPIIIKEVGFGLDTDTGSKLRDLGVKVLDIGGSGGTSWAYVEGLRAADENTKRVGATFRDWGIPTAFALRDLKKTCPNMELIATGGIRNGIDVAKAIALGASMAGIGLPLFRAARTGLPELRSVMTGYQRELLITMACTESKSIKDLKVGYDIRTKPAPKAN